MKKRPRQTKARSRSGGSPSALEKRLAALRRKIDAIDADLVRLLNARCRVAKKIGEIKRANGGDLYVPEREQAVLARVRARNRGPLTDAALEAIYREIMSAALALEGPLQVGVAGTAQSAVAAAARNHFGASAKMFMVTPPSEAVKGIREGRWHALCIADADLPAACADIQAGRVRACGRAGDGVSVLVPARPSAPGECG